MKVDNDILIEDDIMMTIGFNDGSSGTTSVLGDAGNIFEKKAFNNRIIQNHNWSTGNT